MTFPPSLPASARFLVASLIALVVSGVRAEGWVPTLTLNANWHDNVSNASASADRVGALQTSAALHLSERYSIARDDSLHLSARFAGDWWERYRSLNGAAAGARVEWQRKFGLGALAPVVSIELAADVVAANEAGRRGISKGVTLALRKRFNDLWRVALTQEFARHDARQAVFDRAGAETALELGRDVTEFTRFALRVTYRRGDVLSYGTSPRPDLVALAPNRVDVATFDRPMVAYSIDARTVGARASYISALNEQSAVILAYEWRDTERSPFHYVNHLVSLALSHQF